MDSRRPTDVWHACSIEGADQIAAGFYALLLLIAVLVFMLWLAYRRAVPAGGR